jgi:6-phosphogluconolactonase (cycloisomerase 2 family)
MKISRCAVCLALLYCLTLLPGCGSGPQSASTSSRAGSARFTVIWPKPSRLIPAASNSIVVQILNGNAVLATRTLTRPTAGGAATATFSTLPIGILTASATAYPQPDGSGVAQANASMPLSIQAGLTTPFTLTMGSTIDHLNVTPAALTLNVGQSKTVTATAIDASGNVVLIVAGNLQWKSANAAAATVDATGSVTGAAVGNTSITVTESESGKSATIPITITPFNEVAYIAIGPYPGSVSAFHINQDGTLTRLPVASAAAGLEPFAMTSDANSRFVYACNMGFEPGNGTISQYAANADGSLSPLSPSSVAVNVFASAITLHPNGQYAYVSNYGVGAQLSAGNISQLQVNANGTLTPLSPAYVLAGSNTTDVKITPNGRFAYAGSSTGVYEFAVGASGLLTPLTTPSINANLTQALLIDPASRYVYSAGSYSVVQYQINSDGTLSVLSPSSVGIGGNGISAVMHPSGHYLYVVTEVGEAPGSIAQFKINADGTLSPLSPATIAEPIALAFIAIDRTGQFVYVGDHDKTSGAASNIYQFKVNADGTLAPLSPASIPAGGDAASMTFVLQQ